MNIFQPDILSYFAILVLAIIVTYLLGVVFLLLNKDLYDSKNNYANVFMSYMFGYVVLVTLFSIIWTRGNTIMLISLLLFAAYFIWLKPKSKRDILKATFDLKKILYSGFVSMIVFVFSFGICYYLFFIRSEGEIWCDHTFYSNVSCHLFEYHVENAELFSDITQATNYHWGDLWLTSIFGGLFKANYLYVLLLVTYPFLMTLAVLGGIGIAYEILKDKFVSVVFGIAVLFAVPILTLFIHWVNPAFSNLKLLIVYDLVLLFFYFYLKGNHCLAFLSLLLLVPFYSTVSPGILVMVCVLSFILKKRNHSKSFIKCIFNRYVIISFAVCCLYILFYGLQHIIKPFDVYDADNDVIISNGNPVGEALLFGIKRTSRFLVLIPAFVCLVWMSKKKRDNVLKEIIPIYIAVLVALIISAFIGGFAKLKMLDGGQVTTNFTEPFFNVLCWVTVLLLSISVKNKWQKIIQLMFVLVYIGTFLARGGSPIYVKLEKSVCKQDSLDKYLIIKEELKGKENISMAYYRNYSVDENFNTHKTRLRMFYPIEQMPHLVSSGYYAPYCLSALDIPDDVDSKWNEKASSALYQYIGMKMNQEPTGKEFDLILKFIEDKKINYIIVEKHASLPDWLRNKTELVANINGSKFYKLNK